MSFYLLVPKAGSPTGFELKGDDASSEIETLRRLHDAGAWGSKAAQPGIGQTDIDAQILKLRLLYSQMQDADALDSLGLPTSVAR